MSDVDTSAPGADDAPAATAPATAEEAEDAEDERPERCAACSAGLRAKPSERAGDVEDMAAKNVAVGAGSRKPRGTEERK